MSTSEGITAAGAARTAPDQPPSVEAPSVEVPSVEAPADPPLDQPFDEDGLYSLRSAVAAHATELGAGSVVGDAVLVAHELSSNAVRHGGRCGRLLLWRDGERLYCQVTDSGGGISDPAHAGTSRPPPSVPGGRGLWIVRQLASIEIATGPTGTTITAALALRSEG